MFDSIADLVVHDKAGERILEHLSSRQERAREKKGIHGAHPAFFKNSTDSASNSYGCHKNYLTTRRTTRS